MPDPITTIITTAIEHAPSAVATAATLKAAKGFLAKVVGPAIEEMGEIGRDYVKGWRAKNGSQTLVAADKLLLEVEREPQAVPLKTLLPLLGAASLEEEPRMTARWAALLANAADPAQRVAVQPGFSDVLRQLTPMDAQLIEIIANVKATPSIHITDFLPAHILHKVFEPATKQEVNLAISNLARLGLCVTVGQQPLMSNTPFAREPRGLTAIGPGVDHVRLTPYGVAFLTTVTPPTS